MTEIGKILVSFDLRPVVLILYFDLTFGQRGSAEALKPSPLAQFTISLRDLWTSFRTGRH